MAIILARYKLGQILEELKISPDSDRDPEYFEVVRVYDPPMVVFYNHEIYADIEDQYGNIIQLDSIYELIIKPVEEA